LGGILVGWLGDGSLATRPRKRISSYTVGDELIATVRSGLFLRLRRIIVIGHSAGGQFVGRYAAGTQVVLSERDKTIFIVVNPFSYLYLDDRRPILDKAKKLSFERPPKQSCPNFNNYRYGLERKNAYMSKIDDAEIRNNLFTRKVYFVVGEEDNADDHPDNTCRSLLQGKNRYQRWQFYKKYSKTFQKWRNSTFLSVRGIGHSSKDMYQSKELLDILQSVD
jgi:hypothetical protein